MGLTTVAEADITTDNNNHRLHLGGTRRVQGLFRSCMGEPRRGKGRGIQLTWIMYVQSCCGIWWNRSDVVGYQWSARCEYKSCGGCTLESGRYHGVSFGTNSYV